MPLGAAVTCTIVNTDNTPTLKLVKTVTNNDGGTKVADDYTCRRPPHRPGPPATAPTSRRDRGPPQRDGGVEYDPDRDPAPERRLLTTGEWSCTAGTFDAPTRRPRAPRTDVTCTIVNTDDTPTLTLVKTVTNDDGGTTMAADYDLTATAASGRRPRNCPDIGDPTVGRSTT